jgi:hypothetical protein
VNLPAATAVDAAALSRAAKVLVPLAVAMVVPGVYIQ